MFVKELLEQPEIKGDRGSKQRLRNAGLSLIRCVKRVRNENKSKTSIFQLIALLFDTTTNTDRHLMAQFMIIPF